MKSMTAPYYSFVLLGLIAITQWVTDPGLKDNHEERSAEIGPMESHAHKEERAIESSLEFLKKDAQRWIDERGCVSCHHVPLMIWAHNEARDKGLGVDTRHIQSVTNWAFVSMLAEREEFGGADSISQMILGRDRQSPWRKKPPRHFKTVDPFETLFEILADRQREDGSWPPEGQLKTPPEITTGWAILALASRADQPNKDPGVGLDVDDDLGSELGPLMDRLDQRIPESKKQALKFIANLEKEYPTNEWLVVRLLLASYLDDESDREKLLKELLDAQNKDGGWSNRPELCQSDPLATGMTLYALSQIPDVSELNQVIPSAREFLLKTQHDNGHWDVAAKQIRPGKQTESLDEVFTYWGTAWATIGLLRTMPDVEK